MKQEHQHRDLWSQSYLSTEKVGGSPAAVTESRKVGEREREVTFQRHHYIDFRTSKGRIYRGTVRRCNPTEVIAEIHDHATRLQSNERLPTVTIMIGGTRLYQGGGTLITVTETGLELLLTIELPEGWYRELRPHSKMPIPSRGLPRFSQCAEQLRLIDPVFKGAVGDLVTLFGALDSELDEVEISLDVEGEDGALLETWDKAKPEIFRFLRHFEYAAEGVPPDRRDLHASYVRAHLHPFLLSSPIIHRSFFKPLGYPGDYVIMNMLLSYPFQGNSLLSKFFSASVITSGAGEVIRHRMMKNINWLEKEVKAAKKKGERLRVLVVGAGPSHELQTLVRSGCCLDHVEFDLVDADNEPLLYAETQLSELMGLQGAAQLVNYFDMDAKQLIRSGSKMSDSPLKGRTYHVVLCTGLFDYLNGRTCERLVSRFVDLLVPGGVTWVSNFTSLNPVRYFMEYITNWQLIYREESEIRNWVPETIPEDNVQLLSSPNGAEITMKIRKPGGDH